MNVYPAIDLLDGRVVRLHRGKYSEVTYYPPAPEALIEQYSEAKPKRIHLVDLSGARDGKATQIDLIASLLRRSSVPIQVGGGIRTIEQIETYLGAGVERVVLGTSALLDPSFLAKVCSEYPVVVAVDAQDGRVAIRGWTETSDVLPEDLARRAQSLGAKAVLYTVIARDGTGSGPDVDATAALAAQVQGLEVIASGGIGSLDHLRSLAQARDGVIQACVVGRALLDGTIELQQALAATTQPS